MKSKITSFEGACKAQEISSVLPDVSALPEKHQKSILAFYMLTIIIQALNEGWTPNWSNVNEYKYYNYFFIKADKKRPSGFGFSVSFCTIASSYSGVGSRLCFKSEELAAFAREQFKDLYQDYLLIP